MSYKLLHRNSIVSLLFIVTLLLPSFSPSGLFAQEPTTEPTPSVEPSPEPPATSTPTLFEIVPNDEPVVSELPSSTDPVTDTESSLPTAEATAEPEPDTAPIEPGLDGASPSQVQGPVRLDVTIAPGSIKSGSTLTYTYIMTNTTAAAVNPKVRLRWVEFNETDRGGIVQFCAVTGCPAESVQGGATVSAPEKLTISSQVVYQYTITNLAAGQTARFSIRLKTRLDRYPQTAREPVRPAGSAQLFLNDNFSAPVSEDTANTLVVGPVFVLTKAVTNTPPKVYPLETVEFTINVGNATAPGDVINGRIRADALDATNVKLVDGFPNGSEYISAEGNPVVDAQRKTLTWTIPRINKGERVSFKVRYRKSNVAVECGRLNNAVYHATSPEMPIRTGTETYRIDGRATSQTVVTPLEIQTFTADPTSPIYGTDSRLTLKVRSFYNQPITGIKLIYNIQSNAFYLPSSATPAPAVVPGAGQGGRLEWIFNMPAAGVDTPAMAEFSLRIRGAYSAEVTNGTGVAQLEYPTTVPSACTKALNGRANLQPRITLKKTTSILPINGENIVEQGSNVPYLIEVKNDGVETATNLTVFDLLPGNGGANFSYVQGSSLVDGQAIEPSDVANGPGGKIEWQGLNLPAGETLLIAFELRVEGNEFSRYCSNARAAVVSTNEAVTLRSNQICVKINPNFQLAKSVDRAVITSTPAGEVKFTLSLANESDQAYEVGLYDVLGAFTYVSQESGYNTPSLNSSGHLEWPLVRLSPGQSIQAVIKARIPNECISKDYVNEIRFRFVANDGSNYVVQSVPKTEAKVRHNCGTNRLEYSVSVDRATISLKDKAKYSVTIKNLNTTAEMRDIDVVAVLPEGFKFDTMASDSQIRTAPQQSTRPDGRIKLSWRVPQLAASAQSRIVFTGRSGDIVGAFDNWVRASAPNLLEALCRGACTPPLNDQGETVIYSKGTTDVKPLHTALPELSEVDQCANPDDERIYSLSLINTNSVAYASTAVTLTLPLGLHFVDALGAGPSRIIYESDGRTVVVWTNLNVPAKPTNSSSALVKLQVEVLVGKVFNDLETAAVVSSPDGSIPRQDGIDNPKVKMCIDGPAVAKDASKRVIDPSEEFIYQISAVNPGSSAITMNIDDTLPSQLTYVGQVGGPSPTRNGSRLSWPNLSVPAASNDVPGLVLLKFRVKLTGGREGDIVRNAAAVSGASTQVNSDDSSVDVEIRRRSNIYLPMLRK